MKGFLINFKVYFRAYFGKYPWMLRVYRMWKGKADLRITRRKRYCIEGYPRSANTFGVLLIEQCAGVSLPAAHHMHCTAQLTQAIKFGIPAILLIRDPLEAVSSLVLKMPGLSLQTALNWYLIFHKQLLSSCEKLIIVRFQDITNPNEEFIKKLADKMPGIDLQYDRFDISSIYSAIDYFVLENDPNAKSNLELVNNRPTSEKTSKKVALIEAIQNSHHSRIKMEDALKVYRIFSERSI